MGAAAAVVDSAVVAAAATWAVAAVVPRWPTAAVDLAAALRWQAAGADLPAAAAARASRGRPVRAISPAPAAISLERRTISLRLAAISRPEIMTATAVTAFEDSD